MNFKLYNVHRSFIPSITIDDNALQTILNAVVVAVAAAAAFFATLQIAFFVRLIQINSNVYHYNNHTRIHITRAKIPRIC